MYGFYLNSQDLTVALPEPKLGPLKKNGNRDVGQTEDYGTGAGLPPEDDGGITLQFSQHLSTTDS